MRTAMSATDRAITLRYDGTNWQELARSVNAAPPWSLLVADSGTTTSGGAEV